MVLFETFQDFFQNLEMGDSEVYSITLSVDPGFIQRRLEELEYEKRTMAERYEANARSDLDLIDRVYGVLHHPDEETPLGNRSPAWLLEKMKEVGVIRAREKITVKRVEDCLRRLLRQGHLRKRDMGDDVFYKPLDHPDV